MNKPVAQTQDFDFARTGPGTVAGRYMRTFWHPVYRAQDLAAGRIVPIRIMSEDFTLYRGESGEPHIVAPRCAHRGTNLAVGWVEGDFIRCFYHGWKYDQTGQCVEQPGEDATFCKDVRIKSYPTREYLGLIFGYLGEGPTPDLPRFPELEAEGVLEVEAFTRSCNYFSDCENGCDPLHVTFVHQASRVDINRYFDLKNIGAEESDFGVTIKTRRTIEGGGVVRKLFGMPTGLLLRLPPTDKAETAWREFMSWRTPLDDEHYLGFNLNLIHLTGDRAEQFRRRRAEQSAVAASSTMELAQMVLTGKATIDELKAKVVDVVRLQDDVVLCAQGTIPDRDHEYLGRSDVGVILLRRIWRRELQKFARGEPIKQWHRPASLVATNGLATP
jgi:5,5'-dehydrodivanillate O-demethylase oxygenase subunit